jgi:hypothetical protein
MHEMRRVIVCTFGLLGTQWPTLPINDIISCARISSLMLCGMELRRICFETGMIILLKYSWTKASYILWSLVLSSAIHFDLYRYFGTRSHELHTKNKYDFCISLWYFYLFAFPIQYYTKLKSSYTYWLKNYNQGVVIVAVHTRISPCRIISRCVQRNWMF